MHAHHPGGGGSDANPSVGETARSIPATTCGGVSTSWRGLAAELEALPLSLQLFAVQPCAPATDDCALCRCRVERTQTWTWHGHYAGLGARATLIP